MAFASIEDDVCASLTGLAAAFLTGFAFDLFALAARTAFILAFMLALRSAADLAGAVLD